MQYMRFIRQEDSTMNYKCNAIKSKRSKINEIRYNVTKSKVIQILQHTVQHTVHTVQHKCNISLIEICNYINVQFLITLKDTKNMLYLFNFNTTIKCISLLQ